jgi:hypothetical protein
MGSGRQSAELACGCVQRVMICQGMKEISLESTKKRCPIDKAALLNSIPCMLSKT